MKWAKERSVIIYTYSLYVFVTAHVHGHIYKQKGLLTLEGKIIKNNQEIIKLLKNHLDTNETGHYTLSGHQKGDNFANQTTW